MADDRVEIGMARYPGQRRLDAAIVGNQRIGIARTARLQPPVKRAMIEWWGPVIWEYYGSTEMGNVTGLSSAEWLKHPGSVGRVQPGVTLRVVDPEGKDVPPGTIGEVIGKGRHGTNFTYQNAPEKRASMEKYGLITPGDMGYFDQDGFLYLCDRINDMIISGGANIYPAEIERVLLLAALELAAKQPAGDIDPRVESRLAAMTANLRRTLAETNAG